MRTTFLVLAMAIVVAFGYCQNLNSISESFEKLYQIDDQTLHSTDSKRKALYFNYKAIDSSGARLRSIIYKKDLICGLIGKKNKEFTFTLKTNHTMELSLIPNSIQILSTESDMYFIERMYYDSVEQKKLDNNLISYGAYLDRVTHPYTRSLRVLDTKKNTTTLLVDLDISFKDSVNSFDLSQIIDLYKLDDERLLIVTANCSGGCEYYHYFEYNQKENVTQKIDYLKKNDSRNSFYNVNFLMKSYLYDCHLGFYDDYAVKNKNAIGYFIFDNHLNIISRALPRYARNVGYNYVHGKIDSYNINSKMDDGKSVIVPFKLDLALERSLIRIYDNQEMHLEDIKLLTHYTANILQSFIYAKHNFKFTESFYEAYFNLFDFYGDEKKKASRHVKVDDLFTDVDKKNLTIINARLDKLKK